MSYSEKVFNPQHLAKAYEIYAKKYTEWDGDYNRQDLLWQRLMGKAQDLTPMRWKQAVCQLWALTEKNPPDKFKPVKTIYNYITGLDIALLDLVEDPRCSLSSDFAIFALFAAGANLDAALRGGPGLGPLVRWPIVSLPRFSKLMSSTLIELGKAYAARVESPSPARVSNPIV